MAKLSHQDIWAAWKHHANVSDEEAKRWFASAPGRLASPLAQRRLARVAKLRAKLPGLQLSHAEANWSRADWTAARTQVQRIRELLEYPGSYWDQVGNPTPKLRALIGYGHQPRRGDVDRAISRWALLTPARSGGD